MVSLLVVDDEKYAIQGITQGIDWSGEGIASVYEANSAAKAQRLMEEGTPIDIVIADIEMPGRSGLELVEWINDGYPDTQVIFFTGHASFDYAKEAIRLGGVGYLLKPVDHAELKRAVALAMDKVKQLRDARESAATVARYARTWEAQKPLLIERFWREALEERTPFTAGRLNEARALYGLPLGEKDSALAVLISVESWTKPFSARDEEIMEFAVQKAAEEILFAGDAGHAVRDRSGSIVAIRYLGEETGEEERALMLERCGRFVQACRDYFYCSLSCYVGRAVKALRLPDVYASLLNRERGNVWESNAVFECERSEPEPAGAPSLPKVLEWLPLMERNEAGEMLQRLDETFAALRREPCAPETLEAVRHGLLHALYYVSLRKGFPIPPVYEGNGRTDRVPPECRSLHQLEEWSRRTVARFMDGWAGMTSARPPSEAVEHAKRYMQARLHEELTREEIAEHVFLNAAYLSRLFKREVGLTLSDYIQQKRMELAQELLRDTSLKIGDVVSRVGYAHLSHFAKLFKRIVGMGPHEYRKLFGRSEISP